MNGALSYKSSSFNLNNMPDLSGKNAIVTGGNTGIGYETCKNLAKKGANVYMASRSEEKALIAIAQIKKETGKDVEFLRVDLQDLNQTRKAAEGFVKKNVPLDILINNAGIMACPFAKTVDGWETQFATNHLGHFQFTSALMPSINKAKSPRIVNVSSHAHLRSPECGIDFENINNETKYNTMIRYGQSKLANLLFSLSLSKKYPKLVVNSVHPGYFLFI